MPFVIEDETPQTTQGRFRIEDEPAEPARQTGAQFASSIYRPALEGLGMAAGGALGTLAGPGSVAAVPLGMVGGQMAGANLADVADTYLGVKAPQTIPEQLKELPAEVQQAMLSQVIGQGINLGIQGTVGAFKGLVKRLPGASAVTVEDSIAKARSEVPSIGTPEQAKMAWAKAAAARGESSLMGTAPSIPTPAYAQKVTDLLDEAVKSDTPNTSYINTLAGLRDKLLERGGNTPLDVLRATQADLNSLKMASERAGGMEHGGFKQLLMASYDDLERVASQATPVGHDVSTLMDAVKASKRQFAADEVKSILESNIRIRAQDENMLESINKSRIIDQLRKGPLAERIARSLEPGELDAIITRIKGLPTPALPPPKGVQAGSYHNIGRALTGATIGGIMGAPLGPVGSTIGATAGGAVMTKGRDALINLMMSPRGRDFVRWASEKGIDYANPLFAAMANTALDMIYQSPATKKTLKPDIQTTEGSPGMLP